VDWAIQPVPRDPLVTFRLKWNDKGPCKRNKTEDDKQLPGAQVLLVKPMAYQLVRKFSAFYGKRSFDIPRLQQPSTCPCPEPDEYISYHAVLFFTMLFSIILPSILRSSKLPDFFSFPHQSSKQCMYFLSHLQAPHASPHQDNSVNYFVPINTNN
jgi:hypothetical protein